MSVRNLGNWFHDTRFGPHYLIIPWLVAIAILLLDLLVTSWNSSASLLPWTELGKKITISAIGYDLWFFSSGYIWFHVSNYFESKDGWFEEDDDFLDEIQHEIHEFERKIAGEVKEEIRYLNPTSRVDKVLLFGVLLFLLHYTIYAYFISGPCQYQSKPCQPFFGWWIFKPFFGWSTFPTTSMTNIFDVVVTTWCITFLPPLGLLIAGWFAKIE